MNKLTKERSQARLVSLLKNAHDCATVELNENEVLFVEGDEANHVYLVLSGSIDIIDKKKQNILVTLKKGSLLGETAILTQLPRNATARASGGGGGGGGSRKTTLLKIGSRRFMNLIGTQLRQDLMANKQESLIRSMAQANVEGSTE
jgi:signal-transduction protein with cAMP-binding, CBS, and nucleotidyltransferase domain